MNQTADIPCPSPPAKRGTKKPEKPVVLAPNEGRLVPVSFNLPLGTIEMIQQDLRAHYPLNQGQFLRRLLVEHYEKRVSA